MNPNLIFLIPAFPFLGFLVAIFLGRRLPKKVVGVMCCALVALSFALSVTTVSQLGEHRSAVQTETYDWISVGGEMEVELPWALYVDHLSGTMILGSPASAS